VKHDVEIELSALDSEMLAMMTLLLLWKLSGDYGGVAMCRAARWSCFTTGYYCLE